MSDDSDSKLPVEVAEKFIDVQSKELDVRIKEVELSNQDIQNQKEIALATIKAQAEDLKDDRSAYNKESTKSKFFITGIVIILCLFVLALAALGQAGMAQKIIETAVVGCLGAFGGYGYSQWKGQNNKGDN